MCFVSQGSLLQQNGHLERFPILETHANPTQYLVGKCAKHSLNFEQVENDYATIVANYQINDEGVLFSKVDNLFNSSISFNNKTLMKVVYKSNKIISEIDKSNTVHEFNVNHQNEIWKIGAFRNKEGKLTIFKFEGTKIAKENPNFLGEGNCGVVQKITDFSNAQFIALKTSKSNEGKKINSIKIEVNMLKRNLGSGLQRGINGLLAFNDGILGCTTKYYNKRSLSNGINELHESITQKELLQLSLILLDALKALHSKGIVHGDIKPANCLLSILELNDKLVYEIVLGDLGGATSKEKLLKSKFYMGTSYTGGYFTLTDIKKLKKAHEKNKEEWLGLCKKRDVFAIAQIIWFMLTKEKPYQTKECPFANEKTKIVANTEVLYNIEVVEELIGEKATRILIRALEEDPSERPSIDEIIDVMNSAILQKNSNSINSPEIYSDEETGTYELSNSDSEN